MTYTGLQLKHWKIGEKLGSGACSEVYLATSSSSSKDVSYAMKISAVPPKGPVKKKKTNAQRFADAIYAEHLLYNTVLQHHPAFPPRPKMYNYGEEQGVRYLVLERLGQTLGQVLNENGPISERSASFLGQEMLDAVEYLHGKTILYVDIKPENFMISIDKTRLYCVDFGLADKFTSAMSGKHKAQVFGSVVGTPTFLSTSCHMGSNPSRKDDIESIFYVLMFLMRGELPWQSAKSDNEGAKMKENIDLNILCANVAEKWKMCLETIRGCEYAEAPDYDYFRKLLQEIGGVRKPNTVFDFGGNTGVKSVTAKKSTKTKSVKTNKVVKSATGASKGVKASSVKAKRSSPSPSPPLSSKRQATPPSVSSSSTLRRSTRSRNPPVMIDLSQDISPLKTGASPRRRPSASARAIAASAAASGAARLASRTRKR